MIAPACQQAITLEGALMVGILVALVSIVWYLVGKAVGMVKEWHDYEHRDDDGT